MAYVDFLPPINWFGGKNVEHTLKCRSNVGMGTLPCNCGISGSVADLGTVVGMRGQFDGEQAQEIERLIRQQSRRVLVTAARRMQGGYYFDSPEEKAVEMLLRIAQEIPL